MTSYMKFRLRTLTLASVALACTLAAQETGSTTNNTADKAPKTAVDVGATSGTFMPLVTYSPNEIINMQAYGADPTGVKDSAPATRSVVASLGTTPATLYFPKGTYRFASWGPIGNEECVRINSSISLLGDGPGLTVFTDDPKPACQAQFGYLYTNSASVRNSDYSFESDAGFAVLATTAQKGSSSLTLITHAQASLYFAGQYVYVRGDALPQAEEYHGELNRVTSSGDSSTGEVSLLWPLSSAFTQDSNLQLNLVSAAEVLTNIQISGITFNFHNAAFFAAQVLGLQIFNNTFNYLGSALDNEIAGFNQDRNVEFYNNVVNNPLGLALDPERTSNTWNIHDNTLFGAFNAGEADANINFHDNTITCVNMPSLTCVRFGGSTGNTVNHNHINVSCPSDVCHAVTDVSGPVTSPTTVISNNTIVSKGARVICAETPGTVISGNTIFTDATGIDMAAGGISAFNNTITMTSSGGIGCVLVEGKSHNDLIEGLNCVGYNTASNKGIWIADNGPQSTTPLIIDGAMGSNLNTGIFVTNGLHDVPIVGGAWFTNTAMPFLKASN
jgi:hypothetical protein